MLKSGHFIDPERTVLYREDCRYLATAKPDDTGYFIVEISRSKNKIFILAVRIPDHLVKSVVSGRRSVINIAVHPHSYPLLITLTEKQAKKLLSQCDGEFKRMLDLLSIEKGRLELSGLDDMLRFGGSTSPKTFRSSKFDDLGKKQFNTIITQSSGE